MYHARALENIIIMSTSSLYEPDEDEEASDSDVGFSAPKSGLPASSPGLQGLRLSSPSGPDEEDVPSRPESRTSKGPLSKLQDTRRKALTTEAIDAYREILDEVVSDILSGPKFDSDDRHNVTQNGIVTWTPKEKEIFFNLLARKGKNGVQEIADAIGTKSKLEVQDYLNLLHKGLEYRHLQERHSRTIVLGDVPAAAEISEECCQALDEIAEFLSLEQRIAEDRAGKSKYNDFWIITREKAEQIEEQIKTLGEETTFSQDSSIFLTASLLNIRKWIQLSERFFMNFGGPRIEDNWVNIAYEDETPSLTCDAFADFYALTISVTRRLVQSALFFAMSRIRNMKSYGNRQKSKLVRTRDIRAALDVLNMKRNSYEFWIGVARRCSLDVADIRHRKGWKSVYLSYDQVEDALSGKEPFPAEVSHEETSVSRQPSENEVDDDISDESYVEEEEEEDEGEADSDDDLSEVRSRYSSVRSSPAPTSDEETPSNQEDIHAEYVDQQASRAEELRIWKLLNRPLPPSFDPPVKTEDEDPAALRKPIGERKTKQDLIDWRDRILYRSEWEEYGHEVFDIYEDLAEHRRKRRRIEGQEPAAPTWSESSDTSPEPERSDYVDEEVEGDQDVETDQDRQLGQNDGDMDLDNGSNSRPDTDEHMRLDSASENLIQEEEKEDEKGEAAEEAEESQREETHHHENPPSNSDENLPYEPHHHDTDRASTTNSPVERRESSPPIHSRPLSPIGYSSDNDDDDG